MECLIFHPLILLTTVHFPKISVNVRVWSHWMLYLHEKKHLSWRMKSFSKSRTVWGKQRIIVSILWSWGVKWRRLPWGWKFTVRGAWSELSVFRMCVSRVVSLFSLFLFGLASPLPVQSSLWPLSLSAVQLNWACPAAGGHSPAAGCIRASFGSVNVSFYQLGKIFI